MQLDCTKSRDVYTNCCCIQAMRHVKIAKSRISRRSKLVLIFPTTPNSGAASTISAMANVCLLSPLCTAVMGAVIVTVNPEALLTNWFGTCASYPSTQWSSVQTSSWQEVLEAMINTVNSCVRRCPALGFFAAVNVSAVMC